MTEVEAALAQGIASSLRTLVIASFRAPPNKFVLGEKSMARGHGRTEYSAFLRHEAFHNSSRRFDDALWRFQTPSG